MIDVDKYEGSNTEAWRDKWGVPYFELIELTKRIDHNGPEECTQADLDLFADAPLLLEEVKRLREGIKELAENWADDHKEVNRLREAIAGVADNMEAADPSLLRSFIKDLLEVIE